MADREEIENADDLYRRIHPDHINPVTQEVSSAAFVGYDSFNLSVDLGRLTTPDICMNAAARFQTKCVGVAAFTAGSARALSFLVEHEPLSEDHPDGPNPAHTLVIGEKDKPGRRPAKSLARACRWVWPESMESEPS